MEVSFVVFTCTFYASAEDIRFQCCLSFLEVCRSRRIRTVVVDASPDAAVRELMKQVGGDMVQICPQTAVGKKGAALREAAALASHFEGVTEDTFLCWQEPEKVEMTELWEGVFRSDFVKCSCPKVDIVVPSREMKSFEASYPVEQFHSENYANMYLDCLAKKFGQPMIDSKLLTLPVDWHFGPFAFRCRHLDMWTNHDGDLWDAQVIPIVQALQKGLCLRSVEVVFNSPLVMKEMEEGNIEYIEKRLFQINYLDPKVKKAWSENVS